MGMTWTGLTSGSDDTDGASWDLAAVSPNAYRTLLLIMTRRNGDDDPTPSSANLTWHQISLSGITGSRGVFAWYADTDGNPPTDEVITVSVTATGWCGRWWRPRRWCSCCTRRRARSTTRTTAT